jgi:hypothetical protein
VGNPENEVLVAVDDHLESKKLASDRIRSLVSKVSLGPDFTALRLRSSR